MSQLPLRISDKLYDNDLSDITFLADYVPDLISFKFQDESTICAYKNKENYLDSEDSYYMDSPPLSIRHLLLFMESKITLESLSVNEVYSMFTDIIYFFGEEAYDISNLIEFSLTTKLNEFLENNYSYKLKLSVAKSLDKDYDKNILYDYSYERKLLIYGVITEIENTLLVSYSKLFYLYNVTNVILIYDFHEDIPYEYIYPSNLHELFPKIKEYSIKPYYRHKKRFVPIIPSDPHYNVLYKEYKRQYYHTYYPDAYETYKQNNPEIEYCKLKRKQIFISSQDNNISDNNISDNNNNDNNNNDNNNNHNNNRNKNNIYEYTNYMHNINIIKADIHHEIIPIDIDEEIKKEKEENKPVLYIESIYDDIREYTKHDQIDCFLYFNFKCDFEHPILNINNSLIADFKIHSKSINNTIFNYILNLPICKELFGFTYLYCSSKLQVTTPVLLQSLYHGLFDTLKIINPLYFIRASMYPEYIQLFKDIITTHVFPNVTTLEINSYLISDSNINLLQSILALITRNNFPKLSIYIITKMNSLSNENEEKLLLNLFPLSLLELIDNIHINKSYPCYTIHLSETIVNHFILAKQKHQFHIHTNFSINNWNYSWEKLFNDGLLYIDTFLHSSLGQSDFHDYLNYNFNNYHLECIMSHYNKINYSFTEDMDTTLFHFLSLFSDNLMELEIIPFITNYIFLNPKCENLPLWRNIESLTIRLDNDRETEMIYNGLFNYLQHNVMFKLKHLILVTLI
ncbi:hypothetical protein WA158_006890 [Blastocystis sp. Blastoise]